jgi:glutamate racemase
MLAQGMDELVLACTHYPFVRPMIERICGPSVEVIDPAPAVARQVERLLEQSGLLADARTRPASSTYWTSGDPEAFMRTRDQLGLQKANIGAAHWEEGELILP